MRPHIVLNAAISVDGKITTAAGDLQNFGGEEDLDLMDELRANSDAVLIGAGTLRAEDPLLTVRSPERIRRRLSRGVPAQPSAVVVSCSLDFPIEGSRFFSAADCRKYICTTSSAAMHRMDALRSVAEFVLGPPTDAGLDLACAVEALRAEVGVERLLLEGGGTLNFAMLAANLVDEIYLTVCPLIIGGSRSPTVFDGVGFPAASIRKLKLENVREGAQGRLFLHYKLS